MQAYLLVGAGGAIGAMTRYGLSVAIGRWMPTAFPLPILAINLLGSLAMGLLVGALARFTPSWQGDARLFLAVGVLGGFTTFSSFSLDAVSLIERGEIVQAAAYVGLSVLLAIVALFGGLAVMRITA